ncbi:Aminopeptidase 2 mitochondrial [Phlyctochytrium bullatum]|nr:Aminopeptidase 2 mitochondrial [Phlyctochytrium bullatum]
MCMLNTEGSGAGGNHAAREVLPKWLTPRKYNVRITPDLETFKFKGTVSIECAVNESTKKVSVNVNEIEVSKASVTVHHMKTETSQVATAITYDKKLERVTFEFDQEIPAGATAVVNAEFTGIHNDQMAGFYRSSYTDAAGNKKHIVVTQFEATDCRRAFPSFDEPALKAVFDVTLVVPQELTALSNMNAIGEEIVEEDGKKLKAVSFATTPIMSTYLVAFAVGDIEFIETVATPKAPADAKPVIVRVYTLKGEVEQGRFGLEVAARTLEYFSEYFNEAYPLPKLDLIAIPDFAAGAMENWGLITYRNIYLLFDEKKSSAVAKQRIAYVVGHELAHQWFGNLVTMNWWNDLWLNEGFATFVGWLAVDKLFPEWDIWTQFIIKDYAEGISLDGLRSSHPIQVDVASPAEINEIFDAISYSKGASIIRMLNNSLGGDIFMNGVRNYLQKFKFRNTETTDLWNSLAEVSGVNVEAFMAPWTLETGYPLVSIVSESFDAAKGELTITVRQNRFLSSGDVKPEEDKTVWWIPISIITHVSSTPTKFILSQKEGSVSFPYTQSENAFFKLNAGVSGFYRVKLEEKHAVQIGKVLTKNPTAIPTGDRVSIVSDAFALSVAGLGNLTTALEVIKALKNEDHYIVLDQIANRLNQLSHVFYKDEGIRAGLTALQRQVFATKVSSVGWEYPEKEAYLDTMKRSLVISVSAKANDASVQEELRQRFQKFAAGDHSALHPNLRVPAYTTTLRTSKDPEEAFEKVLGFANDSSLPADQQIYALISLGAVNSVDLVKKFLTTVVFDAEKVRPQDMPYAVSGVVENSPLPQAVRPYVWEWMLENWAVLYKQLSVSLSLLGRIVESNGASIGLDFAETMEKWSKGEDLTSEDLKAKRAEELKGVRRQVQQTLEKIRTNSRWVARERDAFGLRGKMRFSFKKSQVAPAVTTLELPHAVKATDGDVDDALRDPKFVKIKAVPGSRPVVSAVGPGAPLNIAVPTSIAISPQGSLTSLGSSQTTLTDVPSLINPSPSQSQNDITSSAPTQPSGASSLPSDVPVPPNPIPAQVSPPTSALSSSPPVWVVRPAVGTSGRAASGSPTKLQQAVALGHQGTVVSSGTGSTGGTEVSTGSSAPPSVGRTAPQIPHVVSTVLPKGSGLGIPSPAPVSVGAGTRSERLNTGPASAGASASGAAVAVPTVSHGPQVAVESSISSTPVTKISHTSTEGLPQLPSKGRYVVVRPVTNIEVTGADPHQLQQASAAISAKAHGAPSNVASGSSASILPEPVHYSRIEDINRRWNEMMDRTTPATSDAPGIYSAPGEIAPDIPQPEEAQRAQKKRRSISFSDKIMYRTVSIVTLEKPVQNIMVMRPDGTFDTETQDFWSDEDEEGEERDETGSRDGDFGDEDHGEGVLTQVASGSDPYQERSNEAMQGEETSPIQLYEDSAIDINSSADSDPSGRKSSPPSDRDHPIPTDHSASGPSMPHNGVVPHAKLRRGMKVLPINPPGYIKSPPQARKAAFSSRSMSGYASGRPGANLSDMSQAQDGMLEAAMPTAQKRKTGIKSSQPNQQPQQNVSSLFTVDPVTPFQSPPPTSASLKPAPPQPIQTPRRGPSITANMILRSQSHSAPLSRETLRGELGDNVAFWTEVEPPENSGKVIGTAASSGPPAGAFPRGTTIVGGVVSSDRYMGNGNGLMSHREGYMDGSGSIANHSAPASGRSTILFNRHHPHSAPPSSSESYSANYGIPPSALAKPPLDRQTTFRALEDHHIYPPDSLAAYEHAMPTPPVLRHQHTDANFYDPHIDPAENNDSPPPSPQKKGGFLSAVPIKGPSYDAWTGPSLLKEAPTALDRDERPAAPGPSAPPPIMPMVAVAKPSAGAGTMANVGVSHHRKVTKIPLPSHEDGLDPDVNHDGDANELSRGIVPAEDDELRPAVPVVVIKMSEDPPPAPLAASSPRKQVGFALGTGVAAGHPRVGYGNEVPRDSAVSGLSGVYPDRGGEDRDASADGLVQQDRLSGQEAGDTLHTAAGGLRRDGMEGRAGLDAGAAQKSRATGRRGSGTGTVAGPRPSVTGLPSVGRAGYPSPAGRPDMHSKGPTMATYPKDKTDGAQGQTEPALEAGTLAPPSTPSGEDPNPSTLPPSPKPSTMDRRPEPPPALVQRRSLSLSRASLSSLYNLKARTSTDSLSKNPNGGAAGSGSGVGTPGSASPGSTAVGATGTGFGLLRKGGSTAGEEGGRRSRTASSRLSLLHERPASSPNSAGSGGLDGGGGDGHAARRPASRGSIMGIFGLGGSSATVVANAAAVSIGGDGSVGPTGHGDEIEVPGVARASRSSASDVFRLRKGPSRTKFASWRTFKVQESATSAASLERRRPVRAFFARLGSRIRSLFVRA